MGHPAIPHLPKAGKYGAPGESKVNGPTQAKRGLEWGHPAIPHLPKAGKYGAPGESKVNGPTQAKRGLEWGTRPQFELLIFGLARPALVSPRRLLLE